MGIHFQGPEAQLAVTQAAATLLRGSVLTPTSRLPQDQPQDPPQDPELQCRPQRQLFSGRVNVESVWEAQPLIQSFIASNSCVSMKFPVLEPFLLKTPTVTVSVS